MKKLFILFQLLNFIALSSFAGDNPEWMVQITKTTKTGASITGTGYIIERDGKYFIRTAAHVTLGTTEGVQIKDSKGREITFQSNEYLTDNNSDDMIIALAGSDYKELGSWDGDIQAYRLSDRTHRKLTKDRDRNYIENSPTAGQRYSTSFITPNWVDRENSTRRGYERFPKGTYNNNGVYYRDEMHLRDSKIDGILLSDYQVLSGESGSPLVGYTSVPNQPTPIIKGHILNYHRTLEFSKFKDGNTFSILDTAFESGMRGSIDNTSWAYRNGLTYRTDGIADETSFTEELSGNGTGVDGGNGTGVDGGNGTGVDGGNGTGVDGGNGTGVDGGNGGPSSRVNMGMFIDNQQVLAFELNDEAVLCNGNRELQDFIDSNGYIAANWLNYKFLRDLETKSNENLFTSVDEDKLGESIRIRLTRAGQVTRISKDTSDNVRNFTYPIAFRFCVIDNDSLVENKLKLRTYILTRTGIEFFDINQDLSDINFLERRTLSHDEVVQVDLTGIFGVDISSLGEDSSELRDKVYITVRAANLKQEHTNCFLGDL